MRFKKTSGHTVKNFVLDFRTIGGVETCDGVKIESSRKNYYNFVMNYIQVKKIIP